jgi:hypothetical protein
MKLSRIIAPSFQEALKKLMSIEVSAKTAMKVKVIAEQVQQALNSYEEQRIASLNIYGPKKEDGTLDYRENGITMSKENFELFSKSMEQLHNIEVPLDSISTEELQEAKMSANDLVALDSVIV